MIESLCRTPIDCLKQFIAVNLRVATALKTVTTGAERKALRMTAGVAVAVDAVLVRTEQRTRPCTGHRVCGHNADDEDGDKKNKHAAVLLLDASTALLSLNFLLK